VLTIILRGFRCHNQNGNTCIALITSGTETAVPTGTCSGSQLVSLAEGTFPDTITITATATGTAGAEVTRVVAREITLLAPMFQLNYQSSDLATGSSSTSSTGSALSETTRAESSASTTNPASSDSTSSTSPSTVGQGGLSTGAVVGIGVGAALGGIVLGILAILLFLRSRKRKREMEAQGGSPSHWTGGPPPEVKYYYEADTSVLAEMPVQNHFYPGVNQQPAEMPTGPDRLSHFHGSEGRN
jgi:hypothetical protein